MARLSTEDRRAQLLELGIAEFSRSTYDSLSIDDIAQAAGISKGLLYHYFPTKRDFYVAVLREASQRMLAHVNATADEQPSPPDRMRAGLDAYFSYVKAHGPAYVALLRGGIGSDPEVARIIEEVRWNFVKKLLEGMAVPEPPPPVRMALRGWIGFVEAVSLDQIEHADVDPVAVRETMVDLFVVLMLRSGFVP